MRVIDVVDDKAERPSQVMVNEVCVVVRCCASNFYSRPSV